MLVKITVNVALFALLEPVVPAERHALLELVQEGIATSRGGFVNATWPDTVVNDALMECTEAYDDLDRANVATLRDAFGALSEVLCECMERASTRELDLSFA